MSAKVSVNAPLSGVLIDLETVPDPVFSQKMVGDGIAIDPTTNTILAPFDGTITTLHPAKHAIAIKSTQGLEMLIHVGLDTVKLRGQGFESHVELEQSVKAGEKLLSFEADTVAQKAKSLLTMIIFTNSEEIAKLSLSEGLVTAGESTLAEITLATTDGSQADDCGPEIMSDTIIIPNPTGLHARPSAVLSKLCKRFEAKLQLQKDNKRVNAASVVAIMGLEVGRGDKVQLIAKGPQAREALDVIVPQLQGGLGEDGVTAVSTSVISSKKAEKAILQAPKSGDESLFLGIAASQGIAVGKVFQLRQTEIEVSKETSENPSQEADKLKKALISSTMELDALIARLHSEASPAKAAIFAAHQELLDDPDLLELAERSIAQGLSAPYSWKRAYTIHADRLAALKNELLAARASDLRDVGRRVLSKMVNGIDRQEEIPEGSILIAEDLSPSDTANLDRSKVLGFCTTLGGATSHVAILARSLELPAIAGIEARALEIKNGSKVILFGGRGKLKLHPSEELIAKVQTAQEKRAQRQKEQLASAQEKAETTDGQRIEVAVNVGGAKEAEQALTLGAEGIGLLRSEFLFLGRSFAPDEDEQFEAYSAVAKAIGKEKTIIIRTLDVGGDKPLPYLPISKEDNPFLGQRGIRVLLDRPDIFRPQIRAILRASAFGKVHIMFPMITSLSEMMAAKAVVREEEESLGMGPIPVGMMVEVPAAALCADILAKEADFFSIGTNDLTQYTLAMDRGHPQLAAKIDGLHPAVLRLIKRTVDAAHAENKWVGVCGGIAGDQAAIPILLGLGVDELSVSVPLVPASKARVREYSLKECQDLAEKALACEGPQEVRALCPNDIDEEVTL